MNPRPAVPSPKAHSPPQRSVPCMDFLGGQYDERGLKTALYPQKDNCRQWAILIVAGVQE